MRKNKKFLTFMVAASLCAVQFACPMSMVGVAAEQTIYTGTCGTEGDNITWTYDVSTQTMTFSGTGAMNDFSDGEEIPWMSGELSEIYDAKNIIYEEGITDVGDIISGSIRGKSEDEWQEYYDKGDMSEYYLVEHYDVTIPESATAVGTCWVREMKYGAMYDITYHVKHGSWAYYYLYEQSDCIRGENFDVVATEVAEKEALPTEGETEHGLRWKFDYETATLTLGGTDVDASGSFRYDSDVRKVWRAAKTIMIEKDFVVPADIKNAETGEAVPFEHFYMYRMLIMLGRNDKKTIYCYEDSPFAQEYEAYAADFSEWLGSGNQVVYMNDVVEDDIKIESNNAVLTGDLNMDGNVNLMDAIHLNKYTAKIVDLSDTQRAAADCDGDGLVNDADVTTLMEFLILQIPSLPYTGAEA